MLGTPILVWNAWSWGRHSGPAEANLRSFRVTGSSMAPTFSGNRVVAHCTQCDLHWNVDGVAAVNSPQRAVCFHCGQPLDLGERVGNGDVVQLRIDEIALDSLSVGDCVAIQWQGELHLKRLAAMPGETVDVDGMHLIVNGQRLEDRLLDAAPRLPLPQFPVDRDAKRSRSRWTSQPPGARRWQRVNQAHWRWEHPGVSPWLIYHHQSVGRAEGPSVVWDDYPFNIGLTRRLYPVDRLQLRCESVDAVTTTMEVAFWSGSGGRLAVCEIVGAGKLEVRSQQASATTGLPVSPTTPLAIRVTGPTTLANLAIDRLVQYRLRPADESAAYPLVVGPNQCYVVGDNVPLSVDSRELGSLPIAAIRGIVVANAATAIP